MTMHPPQRDSPGPFGDLSHFKHNYIFGSPHPSAVNVLMGDGGVRRGSYHVDPIVWWYLGRRDDGVAVSLD